VGERARLKAGTVAEDSEIGEEAQVGPYAHLRPGSVVGPRAKIGNFVELKKTRIGAGTSVAHLSYLGDAEVGERVNIGCGFVTCNFDGRVIEGSRKHRTVIEDDVFLGSDCQTVAPVRVARGAYVASGSTITENVEAGALAIARCRQVNKPGYASKLRAEVADAGMPAEGPAPAQPSEDGSGKRSGETRDAGCEAGPEARAEDGSQGRSKVSR
jgi:bifunctional UDP-N-acetylglucosamine pyrophosphorylase/glucosamine-1-phosphate N-acetyltransferase